MVKFLVLVLTIALTGAKLGGDIADSEKTVDDFKCLKDHISFLIFRAYRSIGSVDPTAVPNIKNAKAAGYDDIGAYIFPCFKCGDPKGQVIATVTALKTVPYNELWIDVERHQWGTKEANRAFLSAMFDEAPKHGKPVGIYTSSAEWSVVVGNDWTAGAKFKLWWARWDNKQTLDNFQPFAGWTSCYIKQYSDEVRKCNIEYDCNYKN